MSLTKKLVAIFDRVIDFMAVFAVVIIVGMTLLVGADVAMRYLLNNPIGNVFEFTEHSLVYITFLSAAWVLKTERHVKMDTVLNRLSSTTQLLVNSSTSILGAIICLVLFWYGIQGTWDYFQRGITFSHGLHLPQTPFLTIIVVGYFTLFVQFLRRSYGFLGQWRALRSQEQKS